MMRREENVVFASEKVSDIYTAIFTQSRKERKGLAKPDSRRKCESPLVNKGESRNVE
jgi:hypothetical protein